MKKVIAGIVVLAVVVLVVLSVYGVMTDKQTESVTVFHAAGMTPLLDAVSDDMLKKYNVELAAEASGSQVACRKVTELGKECDLIMLADNTLVASLLKGTSSWRIDFASDEVVLGVGIRAKYTEDAENDWVDVLLNKEDIRYGRVDENQGPIGYRCLLTWKLQEALGDQPIYDKLVKKCQPVVDHVTRLTPLLKNGEIDYAFVYKSICVAQDIRYITLHDKVNLGNPDIDYSHAKVSFLKASSGSEDVVEVIGKPICWALTTPDKTEVKESTLNLIRYMLVKKHDLLPQLGLKPFDKPRFYGSETERAKAMKAEFSDFAVPLGAILFE